MGNVNFQHGRLISLAGISLWVIVTALGIFAPAWVAAPASWYLVTTALVVFGLGHGVRRFGWRNSGILFVIAFVIVNIYESSSVATGFPFGFYEHQPQMGMKLFRIPIIIGPIYFGMTYLAWTLAEMILNASDHRNNPTFLIGAPIVATLIITGFDLCIDPIVATIAQGWIYPRGGGFFGTPITNYAGWFLNAWTIFQCFALFLSRVVDHGPLLPASYWYEVSGLWAMMGLQYSVLLAVTPGSVTVHDAGGWAWRSRDILENAAILGVYAMVSAALMAALAVRLRGNPRHDATAQARQKSTTRRTANEQTETGANQEGL